MDIFNMMNNNIEELNEEERELVENFNSILREKIIDELAEYEVELLIKELKSNEDNFRAKMENIFINGKKGYNKMPTKALIDIYIDKKNQDDFINLIESIM